MTPCGHIMPSHAETDSLDARQQTLLRLHQHLRPTNGVFLGSKNWLARIDPTKKTKPSAIITVPARAAVNSQSFAPATEGVSGFVRSKDEAAMSLSSAGVANNVSASTERGAALS